MLTQSLSRSVAGVALLGVSLAFVLSGCSSRPENSPVVRKKFQELADAQTQLSDMGVQMKQLGAEMSAIRKDLGDMKAVSGMGEGLTKLQDFDGRLSSIEKELSKLSQAVVGGQIASTSASAPAPAANTVASAPAAPAAAAPPAPAPAKPAVVASAPKAEKAPSSKGSGASAPVRKASNPEPAKPRGAYYVIQSGDSADTIAKKHGISVEKLLRANRLPANATIFPGQRIYVPGS